MKTLLIMLTVFMGITTVQADPGRSLTSPSDTLDANECVFKNKGVAALSEFEFIVDKCDRRYSPQLLIFADHLPQGACVYNLVQKMTGHTIARVIDKCPALDNQEHQGIIPDAPLEEVDNMPPAPGEKVAVEKTPAKKAAAGKPKPKAQQQPITDDVELLKLNAENLNKDAIAAEADLVQAQKDYDAEKAKGVNANKTQLVELANNLEDMKTIAHNARESANSAKAEYLDAVKKATPAVKPKTNEQVEKGKDGYYINPDEIEF